MRLSCGNDLKTGALPLLCLRCSWGQRKLSGAVLQPPTVVSEIIFKLHEMALLTSTWVFARALPFPWKERGLWFPDVAGFTRAVRW